MTDLGRILHPGRVLSAADVDALSAAIEPAWAQRARRLDERDAAIREALALAVGQSATAAATELASLLLQHLASPSWKAGRPGSYQRGELVHRIARANGGKDLSWKQIARIGRGGRAGEL